MGPMTLIVEPFGTAPKITIAIIATARILATWANIFLIRLITHPFYLYLASAAGSRRYRWSLGV